MTTIGVSVAVPDPWGTRLQDYRVRLGDTAAATIPTHITLLPPIDVAPDRVPDIVDHLRRSAADGRPFTVRLSGTGTFRPVSPVVFVALAEGVQECTRLAAAVRRGPLAVETVFPYHPHVTVAHDVGPALLDRAAADLAGFEASFAVDHLSLYVHDDDTGWSPVRDLGLGAGRTLIT